MAESYAHGHHKSVVGSHARRTAENSAAHLLPYLVDGMSVLDVGCGPGSITADFARLTSGRVRGVDGAAVVIEEARSRSASLGLPNLSFAVGDAYALEEESGSFDIVTAHQLLHHLTRPVDAIREMARVAGAGGLVALREVDYAGVFWYPLIPALDEWLRIMLATGEALGANFAAGRRLGSWAHEAGLRDIAVSGSNWTYANPDDVKWWGESWAERAVASSFATQAIELGLADREGLERIAAGWLEWAEAPGAFMQLPHGEVIARG